MRSLFRVAVAFSLLTAACSQSSTPDSTESPTPVSQDQASPAPTDGQPEGQPERQPEGRPEGQPTVAPEDGTSVEPQGVSLHAVSSAHGDIVVDGRRRTLYVFTDDGPSVSNCRGPCLQTWPPVLADGAEAGEGTDPALVGTTTSNESGRSQLTYNKRPLYYYSGDPGPDRTEGQGVGGRWFVVSPEGEPIR